tara:strand:+ start:4994 stop:6274 length:1281 start_codon:yes stop_codon:yes gene_type:complete
MIVSRKKIIVRGPALSRSGYGEQTRFALRALRSQEDKLDIFLINTNWGGTGWLHEDSDERRWIDSTLQKTIAYTQNNKVPFDMSLQITIPNEWEKIAKYNIGYTAGIETTKIAPVWIEKSKLMDKIIVVSEHAKYGFDNSVYEATNKETGEVYKEYRCTTPIDVVSYPIRTFEPVDMDMPLDYDFNFLAVAQWSPRKNVENTIRWFVEEFENDEVGLVLKVNYKNNCVMDRHGTETAIKQVLGNKERKCKVYMLHGDMSDEEMASLYTNEKIKAFVTLAHGEGFGLPIFEAAYNELPVISPAWGGQCDFLFAPVRDRKTKKTKVKPLFAKVDYTLQNIQKEARWEGVLQADSMWCFPIESSYKTKLREVYKAYNRFKSLAKKLKKHIDKNFTEEQQYNEFVAALDVESAQNEEVEKLFAQLQEAGQ